MQLSWDEVNHRVENEGFPELKRHWQLHTKRTRRAERLQRHPQADLPSWAEPWDSPELERLLQNHIAPHGWLALLSATAMGACAGWAVTQYILAPFILTKWLSTVLLVWSAINLSLMACHLLTVLKRRVVYPLEPLLGRKLASVLAVEDFRQQWEASPDVQRRQAALVEHGIQDWDSPSYHVVYQRDDDGDWQPLELPSPAAQVHSMLVDFLGHKDAATRKHQPGRWFPSLVDGKASVSRFVRRHQTAITASRNGKLPIDEGIALLEELREQEVRDHSGGARQLDRFIVSARQGCFMPANAIRATIWRRDPWVDLTSQSDFYSSASLRGVDPVGRSTKGRLGPFLYLQDPSVTALDFSDISGRRVRARLGFALAPSTERQSPNRTAPVLYIDGIEGTNSLDRDLVVRAIGDYARHCGFAWLAFFSHPHNQTPRYFLQRLAQGPTHSIHIAYAESEPRQYLDGFGLPLEPLEYASPAGAVTVHLVAASPRINNDHASPASPAWARPVGASDRLRNWMRRALLWLVLASAIGYATCVVALSTPMLLPVLLGLTGLGVWLHMMAQRRGLQA